MTLIFNIEYRTSWGEEVRVLGSIPELGNNQPNKATPLHTVDGIHWTAEVDIQIPGNGSVEYSYHIYRDGRTIRTEWNSLPRILHVADNPKKVYRIEDCWKNLPEQQYFYTSAFTESLLAHRERSAAPKSYKKGLLIKAYAPCIDSDHCLALCGNQKALGDWNPDKAALMSDIDFPEWQVEVDAGKISFPLEYKFVLYNKKERRAVAWENNPNRYMADPQIAANETLAASLAFTQYDGTEADSVEMPTLGAKNGLTLASMIGKDFDDPQWETLLDQLTFDEMVNTITLGFHNTAAAASIGKTATKDENGPQGLTAALTGGASAMCYTSEDVMAATFNVDLINEVGKCIGEDCLAMGYSGLYGPGINMHRTAYSGRNFEYYAEDPFVAGTICAAEVQGIQSKGVYVYLKHVALNDSETSRRGVNTWLNEQTAREIYLEVADKAITDGGAWCVMTGFNRWGATWCGANANLLNGFLREELGMRGMCITDFSGSSQYMDLVDGLIAGSDIWDSPMPKIHTTKAANYENDAYIVTQMRNAMHHILYTVVNSNAMNGWSASDTLKTVLPWWQTAIYALIAVLAVLTVLCAWQLSKALKRKKELADTAPAVDQK